MLINSLVMKCTLKDRVLVAFGFLDKFGLVVPYIGLASTNLVVTAATAIYVKRVKRRKEKQ